MPNGYTGRILFIDLTSGQVREESPPEQLYRDFIGSSGLGVRILYEQIKAKSDPLGPANMIGFVTGPLTGTPTPGSGRFTVVTKSPLTGCWADSNGGGSFGPGLKAAGYDGVFFSGISPKPVYVLISDGQAEIRDALHLWGKNTSETDDLLQRELGKPPVKTISIGPAGEKCSLISAIIHDKGRAAGRSGVGAVMGSKRLKAVAVRGQGKITVAYPEKLRALNRNLINDMRQGRFQQSLAKAGTGADLSHLVTTFDSPLKNWSARGINEMPTCINLDGAKMDKYKLAPYGCHACPVKCGAILKVKEGSFVTETEVHRPEYETLAALGNLCLNDNVESIIKANEICNYYGIDTIAAGNVIAFAMECYEKGLITKRDTDGIELRWGNAEAIISLLEKVGKREGFGEILADGPQKAAERIGKGSEEFAVHVHGQALPYHDPRNNPAQGSGYMTDANPSRHMESHGISPLERGRPSTTVPELQVPRFEVFGDYGIKGPLYVLGAAYFHLFSDSGLCALLMTGNSTPLVDLLSAVTGWDYSWSEGLNTGCRILTLRQAFNAREGLAPAEFKLPQRVAGQRLGGPEKDSRIDFDALRTGYFSAMGWDIKSGKPYRHTLIKLGLDKLTGDLWQ